MLTGTSAARAGLTKALCRSAGDGELPNVLMLMAHLATTQTQLAELPPAVLEVRTCTQCKACGEVHGVSLPSRLYR